MQEGNAVQEIINEINAVIETIKKTKEIIKFAYQLSYSIQYGNISPNNIMPEIYDKYGKEFINRDWRKYPDSLKEDFASTSRICIVSFQIIVCKEIYASLFSALANKNRLSWAEKSNAPDLFAAQEILKHTRNTLGHFKSSSQEQVGYGVWDFSKRECPGKLEIKEINVTLDTTHLQGQMFDWDQMDGIQNFIKILDFLQQNLVNRL